MRNFKLLLIAAASTAIVACDSNSGSSSPSAVSPDRIAAESSIEPSGETTMITKVEDMTVSADTDESVLSDYPELGSYIATLDSVTSVNETDAGFDFYAGDQIVLILAANESGDLMVTESLNGFSADSVRLTTASGTQDQELISSSFAFDMSSCRVIEDKEEAQDKDQDQAQDKEEAQDKDQDQAQDKEAPVKEECASISARVDVTEVREEKKQEQAQDKEEAQDKEDPKEEAQDKNQEA